MVELEIHLKELICQVMTRSNGSSSGWTCWVVL